MATGRRDYAERRESRIERLRARAAKAHAEGAAKLSVARQIAGRIPFGQPILVGHHSERRARRDAERIHEGTRRGFAALEDAKALDRRADFAETNKAISSDDPEAIDRLRAKLAELHAEHARWKAALCPKLTKEQKASGTGAGIVERALLEMGVPQISADFIARVGGTSKLANIRAEAKRIEKRIADLEKAAARGPLEPERFGDVTISESENRVCVEFPGKPSEDVRAALKSRGFRWAPSVGAWTRLTSNAAWCAAREIAQGAS